MDLAVLRHTHTGSEYPTVAAMRSSSFSQRTVQSVGIRLYFQHNPCLKISHSNPELDRDTLLMNFSGNPGKGLDIIQSFDSVLSLVSASKEPVML